MELFIIAEGVSSVTATASKPTNTSPFAGGYGNKGLLLILPSNNGDCAGNVQTSPDGSTWSNAEAYGAGVPEMKMITLDNFIRVNNTARTAGSCSFYLIG